MAKPLRDILSPKRRHNELDGNTPDEKKIIAQLRANTKLVADRNGNGDEVFKASSMKRDEKPVQPGDDEHKYTQWNGVVVNVGDDKPTPVGWDGRRAITSSKSVDD